jgi:hypothetical protein
VSEVDDHNPWGYTVEAFDDLAAGRRVVATASGSIYRSWGGHTTGTAPGKATGPLSGNPDRSG